MPHIAGSDTIRSSTIDARFTCHLGYLASRTIRKWIEEHLGQTRTIRGLRKSRGIGCEKLDFECVLTLAADNRISSWRRAECHVSRDWSAGEPGFWPDQQQYGSSSPKDCPVLSMFTLNQFR